MTTIRMTCPTCGAVDMGASRISLSVQDSSLAFICPECMTGVRKRASRKTMALLLAAGVNIVTPDPELESALETASLPLPLDDRSPDPDAPALTLDDLIVFHFLLEDDVALEDFLVAGP